MKKILPLLLALLFASVINAQNSYTFSLVNNGNYSYSVTATPNYAKTTPFPTVSQLAFTIMLPDGVTIGPVTGIASATYTQALFDNLDSISGAVGLDAILISNNFDPRESLGEHVINQPITIATFSVLGSPLTGNITLLDNSSALVAASSQFASFFLAEKTGSNTLPAANEYEMQSGDVTFLLFVLNTESNELEGTSIYPNPVNNVLNIKGLETDLNQVTIYTLSGQRVLTQTSNLETINTSALAQGVYFVELRSKNAVKILKVVKK